MTKLKRILGFSLALLAEWMICASAQAQFTKYDYDVQAAVGPARYFDNGTDFPVDQLTTSGQVAIANSLVNYARGAGTPSCGCDPGSFQLSAAPLPFNVSVRGGDGVLYPFRADVFSQVSGHAGFGNLHATAIVTGAVTPTSYTYFVQSGGNVLGPFAIGNPLAAKALASVAVSYSDFIQIESATLPMGTPVQFRVTGRLDGSLTPSTHPDDGAYAFARFRVGSTTLPSLILSDAATTFQTAIINARVGDGLTVTGVLNAFSFGHAQVGNDSFSGTIFDNEADAGNTAQMFLDPLSPDFFIESNSGAFYGSPDIAAPVPEPGTVVMLLAGLGLMGVKLRAVSGRVNERRRGSLARSLAQRLRAHAGLPG